ncbi:pseudouridine-5'-phosphatase-like isoform X2 [Macrobrachium rosenbergii]|uniref:pseudouridine-5'-phosphatase-like isoform X2 n=1 Tax=Macrobrachium rosenbergii TaxID=79674 RepID=UPI0034D41BDD
MSTVDTSKFHPVTHVIFDLDGLLLDNMDMYLYCHNQILSPHGHSMTWEELMGEMGRTAKEIAVDFCRRFSLPFSPKIYVEKLYSFYPELFPSTKLMKDTVEMYKICCNKVLEPLGYTVSWDHLIGEMGGTYLQVAENICRSFNLPDSPDVYLKKVISCFPEVFPTIKLMKGAEKLVRHLHNHKIPIAIASGGAQDSYELKTTNHKDFVSMFGHVVLASTDPEVKNGKPAPDVFLICAKRFEDSPKPEKCLVFEDAPNGVAAGAAAGMQVVMVPDPRMEDTLKKDATVVLKSLEEFRPEWFGLPPYSE